MSKVVLYLVVLLLALILKTSLALALARLLDSLAERFLLLPLVGSKRSTSRSLVCGGTRLSDVSDTNFYSVFMGFLIIPPPLHFS